MTAHVENPEAGFSTIVKLITRSFMQHPYNDLARIRDSDAATPIENNGMRMWVVGRYEDARKVLADPAMKKDLVVKRKEILQQSLLRPERRPRLPLTIRRNMLDRDEPDHHRLRALISNVFTSSRVTEMRPRITEIARDLLAALPSGTGIDLLAGYARPLAVTLIADMLGIPEDARGDFPRWENDILTSPDIPAIEEAGVALVDFATKILELKRSTPGDDLLSDLIEQAEQGELDDVELVSMVTLLLIAGMEPASAMTNGLFTLLQHPDQFADLLADPGLLPGGIDEMLRYESPFRMLTPRYSECPVHLGDVTIPANELILVSPAAANRDPSRYEEPNAFDIRRDARGHLSFGRGNHRCLGAQLGVMEMEIGFSMLFEAFPRIELAVAPEEVTWRPGMFMRRLDALPLVLGARSEGKS